jgi:hypothetical protein
MAEYSQTSNVFAKMFSEMAAPWCGPLKQVATQYLDTSEKWAQKALELNEKTTAWAKDTPLAPLFETQRSLARQVIETSTTFARQLWQIETKAEEKIG